MLKAGLRGSDIRISAGEWILPASIRPDTVIERTSFQACRPPRAMTFFLTICSAVKFVAANVVSPQVASAENRNAQANIALLLLLAPQLIVDGVICHSFFIRRPDRRPGNCLSPR